MVPGAGRFRVVSPLQCHVQLVHYSVLSCVVSCCLLWWGHCSLLLAELSGFAGSRSDLCLAKSLLSGCFRDEI